MLWTRRISIKMRDHWYCYLFDSCFMAYFSTVTNGRILQALVAKIIELCSSLFTERFVLPYDHVTLILAIVPLVMCSLLSLKRYHCLVTCSLTSLQRLCRLP